MKVFQGGVSDWQPHLNALASVVRTMEPSDLLTTSPSAGGVDAARRFLIMNTLWFDLLACASTGTAPRIPAYREWLAADGIDMASTIGCQNWVMSAIGDIATLDAQRTAPNVAVILEIKELLNQGIDSLDAEEEAVR